MATLNINNLGNAQAMGWADALITRNAAGRIAFQAATIAQGTITAQAAIIDAAATWNNAAVTFTGIKANITNTASNAASSVMDLQVGGSSRFNVSVGTPASRWIGGTDTSYGDFYICTANASILFSPPAAGGAAVAGFTWAGHVVATGGLYLGSYDPASAKARIEWEADDILAMRRTTNAQAWRIYNTYTDASNYERAKLRWNANVFEIGVENAGTGSARAVHISGLPTSNPGPGILWNNAGTPAIGT